MNITNFRNCFTAIFIIALFAAIGCQKNQDALISDNVGHHLKTNTNPGVSFGPSPQIPCYDTAMVFDDLASNLNHNSPGLIIPAPFTNFQGTLDNRQCELEEVICYGGEEEIIYFGVHPGFTHSIEPDELYSIPYSMISEATDSPTQEGIYNRAVALAERNRPICEENMKPMEIIGYDFYIGYVFPPEEQAVIEVAVRYSCCTFNGEN